MRAGDIEIVPASVADAAMIAEVMSNCGSSWRPTEGEIAKNLGTLPSHVRSQYFLGFVDGVAVAHGAVANGRYVDEPAVWIIDVFVIGSHQGRGYGVVVARMLMNWLEPILDEQRREGASPTLVSATADASAGARFAAKFGFDVRETRYVSSLNPATVDLAQFASLEQRVAHLGVAIVTLADFDGRDRKDFERALFELDTEAMLDEPGHDAATSVGFDAWRGEFVDGHDPHGTIVAVHDATPIGLTIHWDEEHELLIASTCVSRQWRGKGIATALKVAGVRYASQRGKPLRAFNSAENANVLAINARLGFVRRQTVTKWHADPFEVQSRLR